MREGEKGMSEIKPALTVREWGRKHHAIQCFDSWDESKVPTGVGEIEAGPGYLYLTSHEHGDFADFSAGSDRHALAALCLHDQPFGFTREDAEWCVAASYAFANPHLKRNLLSLADRIEALLPPESPSKKEA